MSLKNLLKSYKKRTLFTTPSHNQGEFIIPELKKVLGKQFFKYDFSEIEGFDNLKNPQDAIKESMERTAKLYEMEHSFYLTNGSTQGILTILLSFLKADDMILVAKNCHQSVFDAVSLAQARSVILEPDFDKFPLLKLAIECGKSGGIMPAVLNASNEIAVYKFLRGEIGFLDIEKIVSEAVEKANNIQNPSLDEIFEADKLTRLKIS